MVIGQLVIVRLPCQRQAGQSHRRLQACATLSQIKLELCRGREVSANSSSSSRRSVHRECLASSSGAAVRQPGCTAPGLAAHEWRRRRPLARARPLRAGESGLGGGGVMVPAMWSTT